MEDFQYYAQVKGKRNEETFEETYTKLYYGPDDQLIEEKKTWISIPDHINLFENARPGDKYITRGSELAFFLDSDHRDKYTGEVVYRFALASREDSLFVYQNGVQNKQLIDNPLDILGKYSKDSDSDWLQIMSNRMPAGKSNDYEEGFTEGFAIAKDYFDVG